MFLPLSLLTATKPIITNRQYQNKTLGLLSTSIKARLYPHDQSIANKSVLWINFSKNFKLLVEIALQEKDENKRNPIKHYVQVLFDGKKTSLIQCVQIWSKIVPNILLGG